MVGLASTDEAAGIPGVGERRNLELGTAGCSGIHAKDANQRIRKQIMYHVETTIFIKTHETYDKKII